MTATANPSPYSVTNKLAELQKQYEAEAAAAGTTEEEKINPQMQQLQNDVWRNSMQLLPQNTGGSQLNIYGNGVFDSSGKQGQVDPAMAAARLQQVYALRPDLIWPGQNPNGTIQREFTGDRYDR